MTLSRPRESTVRRLFAVSMNRCAFPGCDAAIVGKNVILGEVCHICAVSAGGPRYDPTQSEQERHGFENLMLMCRAHHTLVDDRSHSAVYTVGYLTEAKRKHEMIAVAGAGAGAIPQISDEQLRALVATAAGYSPGAVHMDFRDAVFRVGGEAAFSVAVVVEVASSRLSAQQGPRSGGRYDANGYPSREAACQGREPIR
jgi:hypothetical protein